MNNTKVLKDEKPKCNGTLPASSNKEEKQPTQNSDSFEHLNKDLLTLFICCYEIVKDNKFGAKKNCNKTLTQYILELNDEQKKNVADSAKLLTLLTEKYYKKIIDEVDDYVMTNKKDYTKELSKLGSELILGIAAIFIYHMDEKNKLPNEKEFKKISDQTYKITKSFNK